MNKLEKQLFDLLEKYILLLEDEINDNATFLHENRVYPNEDHVLQGKNLRKEIKKIKKQL